jgi:hypothetical protein
MRNKKLQITGMKTGWAHLIFLLDWYLSNKYQFYTKYYNQVCGLKLILLILGIYLSNIFLPHCDALKLTFSCFFFQMQVALILWLLMLGTFVHLDFGKMASGPSGAVPEKGNVNQIRFDFTLYT